MSTSRFAKLIELAKAPESGQRRDLLREITDLFFETSGRRNAQENALFEEVLKLVAAEMQEGVLAELAQRFAGAPDAPLGLMRDLANHAFVVASPVLRHSKVLRDDDLLNVVNCHSQQHIKAVAQREIVSEAVSDAIVRLGDDNALDALIRNDGAKISRTSMEVAVDRARGSRMLHAGVVARKDIPLDLLNEMYFIVETGLRDQILRRNASVDPADLDEALAKTRDRMRSHDDQASEEHRQAIAFIQARKAAGELNARLLISLYREGKRVHFLWGLAELTGLDHDNAKDLLERKDIDGLAMICRAADIERPLFVTIAVLACGGDGAMQQAQEFGRLYNTVPVEAAQRAMRFFKVRKAAEKDRAAA
jgi:uncharacterized protein (DUF2336 family)